MDKKRWIQIVSLIGLFFLLGLHPEKQMALALIRRGDVLKSRKEYSAAIDAYWQAASLQPNSAAPVGRVGEVYLLQGRYELATGVFQAALRSSQGRPPFGRQARLGLAAAYAALGDQERAMALWRQVLALEPANLEAHYRLGRAYVVRSQFEEAGREFEAILASAGWHPAAHYQLGLLLAAEEPQQALSHLRSALSDAALEPRAWDMIKAVQQAQAMNDQAQAMAALGGAYFNWKEWSLARRAFEQAVSRRPDYAQAQAHLGYVLGQMGEDRAAIDHMRLAVTLDPTLVLGYYFLGMYYRTHHHPLTGRVYFEKVLALDPDNAAACLELARTYLEEREYPQAEAWFEEAAELAADNVEFHVIRAQFHLDLLYNLEKGLAAARKAVELAPKSAITHDLLGWAYYLTIRWPEAERELKKSLELNPDLAAAHYHLGILYASRGQTKSARREYQQALDLDTEGFYRARAQEALRELERGP